MIKALWQKNPRWSPLLLVMLSLLIFASMARAQEQKWATIDTEDGLPSNNVSDLLFDRNGNLWIGTDKGLALFSKTDQHGTIASRPWIRTFTTKDGLAHDDVSVIAEDREGRLWFGTAGGVSRYDGLGFSTFTTKDGLVDDRVSAIAQDREGNLWFGTAGGGASRYDGKTFRTFTTKDGLAHAYVTTITQDREGNLWFGTASGGASRYDGQTFRTFTTKDGLPHDDVSAITGDGEGRLWFATSGGVSRYDGRTFRNFTTKDGLADGVVVAIAQDREGHLWFGTYRGGASRYDGQTFRAFTTKDGLADDLVTAIAEDREGHLWFGTYRGGVSRYDGPAFRTFTTKDGLAGDSVRAIAEDREGHPWFGTHGGGASRYDGQTFRTLMTKDGLAHDDVRAIAQDRQGHVWFGTAGGGASRYDGKTFRTFTTKDGLVNDHVLAIAQDREGRIWFGTVGGASRYDGKSFRTFTAKDGLADDDVRAIAQDREGHLWFGTAGGASRYDGKTFRSLTTRDGLADNYVSAIAEDREGYLWFGTAGGGASRYDGQTFRTFTTKDGLAHHYVRAIAQDRDGRLRLGTDGGVSVYEGTEIHGSVSRLVLALTVRPRLTSYGPPPGEVRWSYSLDDQPAWSEPSPDSLLLRDYWRLGSGKHVLRIRAWDGRANPPRTTVFPFEVSGSEQSIAIAAYLLLLGAPLATGLYWIGRRQAARWAAKRGFNPYRAGLPVGPDLFTGREGLLKEVTAALANHCVLLTGERRIGKTSFLHALGRRLERLVDNRSRWVPLYVSLENVSEEQFYAILAQKLIETVGAELPPNATLRYQPESPPESSPYGFNAFDRDLKTLADALDADGKKPVKLVFLLDEIDVLDSYKARIKLDLRSLFYARPDLHDRVRTVMSGFRLDLGTGQVGSPALNFLLPMTITPFTDEEARRLIMMPVQGFYAYDAEVVKRIVDLSAGRPLTIQALCFRLVEHILGAKRRKVTPADLDAVQERTLEDLKRILESGSSHAAIPASLPEAQERIAELERELSSLRTPPDQAAHESPTLPADSRSPLREGGL